MAAATYNLLVDQGASYYLDVTYVDIDGNSPDLSSGYTASMVFSQNWEGSSVLTATEASEIVLGADGSIIVTLSASQTAALPSGDLVYDLTITKTSNSFADRILRGTATVRPAAA
jgi:hypothetical protein